MLLPMHHLVDLAYFTFPLLVGSSHASGPGFLTAAASGLMAQILCYESWLLLKVASHGQAHDDGGNQAEKNKISRREGLVQPMP